MADRLQITTPANFQRWSLGARALPGGFRGASGPLWQLANENFFSLTQQYVHVESGDLKSTGRETVTVEGSRVVATVEYGGVVPGTGRTVDYAQFELNRGGDHDYMGRAWEEAQDVFQGVFGQTWGRVVAAWNS